MPVINTLVHDNYFEEQVQWLESIKNKQKFYAKISKELTDKLCEYITKGASLAVACGALGINPTTVYRWMHIGLNDDPTITPDPIYVAFAHTILEAQAQQECTTLQHVLQAGTPSLDSVETITKPDGTVIERKKYKQGDWKANAWFLEKTYPQRYKQEKITSPESSTPQNTDVDGEILKLVKKIAQ